MPGFDPILIEKIQQANNIVDVVAEYVSLSKKGKEMVGVCPFHEDHRPSMYVSEVKQIFKCFACGAGGDVITFIRKRENLDFTAALERLAERAGIPVQWSKRDMTRKQPAGNDIDAAELTRVNDWACRLFQALLDDPDRGKSTRAYLESRKISSESIKKWRLGLALENQRVLLEAAQERGISIALLKEAGLVTNKGGQDRFIHRLIFPIIDAGGRVTAFGGRTLGHDPAKYINSPATVLFDKSNSLYGMHQARMAISQQKKAIVVEGYTDCIMAHQAGIENVVATLGTSFASGHARLLRRFAKTVVLLFDGDTAGAEATNRALDVCLRHNIDILIASTPDGMDPCDFIIAQGTDAFQEVLDEAVDVLKYKWMRLEERFEADNSLAGRKEAMDDYLQTIAAAVHAGNISRIDRGLTINRLSSVLGLGTQELEFELSQRIKRMQRFHSTEHSTPNDSENATAKRRENAIEREVLEILLNEPTLFPEVKSLITRDCFKDTMSKAVADIVFAACEKGLPFKLVNILAQAQTESDSMADYITALAYEGEKKGNYSARLQELSKLIKLETKQKQDILMKLPDVISAAETIQPRPYNFGMTN